jgi:hypothetical protein
MEPTTVGQARGPTGNLVSYPWLDALLTRVLLAERSTTTMLFFDFNIDGWVHVRQYWRRPPFSHGVGPKTVFVVEHIRRYPLS